MAENNDHHLIDQAQDMVRELIDNLSNELITDINEALEQNIHSASTNQLHMAACEDANVFGKHKKSLQETFCQEVHEGFAKFKAHELCTQVKESEVHTGAWSLVDDSILEETISINTFSSEMNTEFQDKLWQLERRFAFVNQDESVDESNNPLSPIQFFVALREALKTTPIHIKAKLSSYKVLSQLINQQYATLLNKVNAFFISEGILPELNYELHRIESASEGRTYTAAPEQAEADQQEQSAPESTQEATAPVPSSISPPAGLNTSQIPLVNTIRGLLQKARNVNAENTVVPISDKSGPITDPAQQAKTPVKVVFDESQIVEAVESVQNSAATAHFFSNQENNDGTASSRDDEVLQIPTNIAQNSARVYEALSKASPDGGINAKNMYTIDMVGMLFEYILSDEKLPDSIKTLLSHLHTPFLKLAFLDEDFFENKEHKSRMLLDSLAEAGTSWVNHDGTAQYDMYNEIKRVVKRAVKEFKNDVNLFAELLMEFNLLKKRVSHMHSLRERNSIEKKQGQEKHDLAKSKARDEIKKRIEGRRVPSSIISLLSPWFTYLTFIQLKSGEESEQWDNALRVIDNLITYCSIKQVKQDTTRLAKGFDLIIEQVKEGLVNVAYNQTKATSIIDELEELKDSVLNKKTIKTTTAAAADGDSAVNEEAVAPSKPSVEEERVMNYIKLIEPGTWVEYNKESRLKVNGFNAEAGKYILIDQSSQQVTMLTRLEFARDILAEKATIIDGTAKPLFERALERIHKNLDQQVQASS